MGSGRTHFCAGCGFETRVVGVDENGKRIRTSRERVELMDEIGSRALERTHWPEVAVRIQLRLAFIRYLEAIYDRLGSRV